MFFKTEISDYGTKPLRNLKILTRGGHLNLMPTFPRVMGAKQKTCIFHTQHLLLALQQTILSPQFPGRKTPSRLISCSQIPASRLEGTRDSTWTFHLTSLHLQQNRHLMQQILPKTSERDTLKHRQTTLQPRILYYINIRM